MADDAVQGRFMFGCVDHVGKGLLTEGGRTVEGWGLFEHFCIGRHDPSGFLDYFTLAPDAGSGAKHEANPALVRCEARSPRPTLVEVRRTKS